MQLRSPVIDDVSMILGGEDNELSVNVAPVETTSKVTFVSSDDSVVDVDNTAVSPVDGIATASLKAVGIGDATVTAYTSNGLSKTFNVHVAEKEEPAPTESPEPSVAPSAKPSDAPAPSDTPAPSDVPTAVPSAVPTAVPSAVPNAHRHRHQTETVL